MTKEADELAALREALREELACLWSDFAEAVRRSMARTPDPLDQRTGWSIEMGGVAQRIGDITRLVGPTPWEQVSVYLLLDGWWEGVYRACDLPVPPFDRAKAEEVREAHFAGRKAPR